MKIIKFVSFFVKLSAVSGGLMITEKVDAHPMKG
jgi:hypothetical protein